MHIFISTLNAFAFITGLKHGGGGLARQKDSLYFRPCGEDFAEGLDTVCYDSYRT